MTDDLKAVELLQQTIEAVKRVAWEIPAPNDWTPQLMMIAVTAESELNRLLDRLTRKG